MSLKRLFRVQCDKCSNFVDAENYTWGTTGFKWFIQDGKIKHYCPDCAQPFPIDKQDPNRIHVNPICH